MTDEERSAVDELVDRLQFIEAEQARGGLSEEQAAKQIDEAWRSWLNSDAEDALLLRLVLQQVSGQLDGDISEDAFWSNLNEARAAWLSEKFADWLEERER